MSPKASKRPLSPLLYIKRNPGKSIPLATIILLSVGLVACIIALLDSISLTITTIYSYNRYFAAVVPRGALTLDPILEQTVEQAPNLGKIYKSRATLMTVKTIVGKLPFAVFGFQQSDMMPMLNRVHLRVGEGRLPKNGEPEVALSETILRNLHLKIGDTVLSPESTDSYSPVPVKLVGILKGDEWFAVTSYSFASSNFLLSTDNLFVLAKDPKDQPQLDKWLVDALKNTESRVYVYAEVLKEVHDSFTTLNLIVNICISILVIVIAIMMGLLANIYFTQRMVEFGLLQAIGYTRTSLLFRVTFETVTVVIGGWILGIFVAFGGLKLAEYELTIPRGLVIDPRDPRAFQSTLPIPLVICIFAFITLAWRLRHFDPVAIVERRLI